VLTPRLSSYWVDIVTSVPAAVARPLIEGLRSAVVVRDPAAQRLLPITRTPFAVAAHTALSDGRPGPDEPPFRWLRRLPGRLRRLGHERLWPAVLTDRRAVMSTAPAEAVYAEVAAIGGPNGWYFMNWAWRLRGRLDHWWGGPGVDRRTPLPAELRVGARRDFWQVLEVEPGRRIRLGALMRLLGGAELEWVVAPRPDGSAFYQTVRFRPTGLRGRLYWYSLLPLHRRIFRGMAQAITLRACRRSAQ
jgi:hypothetical protein